jgi:uncharacterized membrane protein YvbJ
MQAYLVSENFGSKNNYFARRERMKNAVITRVEILTATVLLAAMTVLVTPFLLAQSTGQKTFASSKEAVDTFIQAVRAGDTSGLQSILGAGSEATSLPVMR